MTLVLPQLIGILNKEWRAPLLVCLLASGIMMRIWWASGEAIVYTSGG